MPEILRLGKLRQEVDAFKTSLAYIASLKPWVYSASVYSAVKWVDILPPTNHCNGCWQENRKDLVINTI